MNISRCKKLIKLISKYSLVNTFKLYITIPHTRDTSIWASKKMFIQLHKSARLNMISGKLILNESHYLTTTRVLHGRLIIDKDGKMEVNGYVTFYEGCDVQIGKNALLELGNYSFLNQSVKINCSVHISIGDNCAISDSVQIMDSDFHSVIVKDEVNKPIAKPIFIGNNVWIGRGAIILKGVKIGDGAIIGAGSVVTRDIPPRVLAVGNPARVIKENVEWN